MKSINISDILTKEERQKVINLNFNKSGFNIKVKYPSIFASSKILRDFIVDISDFFNFEGNWKSRLTLIVDELNNNGIEYGSNEGDINTITIYLKIINDDIDLLLEVEDTGRGKESKTAEDMYLIKEQKEKEGFLNYKSIRGRGLFMIIINLVDELYFKNSKSGGLIVGIRKKIKKNKK